MSRSQYILVGVIVVVAAALFVAVKEAPAAPPVSWSPSELTETVIVGETQTISVTFTATKDLDDVVVRVVPELAGLVSVEPARLGDITQGALVTLQVIITPTANPQLGSVEGTIQLRRDSHPSTNYSRPLPVRLSIEPFPLPPDPGPAGDATLGGIDSDGDGVRDDLQRYIAFAFPNSDDTSQLTRSLLREASIAAQQSILHSDSESGAISSTRSLFYALDCLFFLRPDDSREIGGALRAEILNTEERSRAWIRAGQHFSGQGYGEGVPLPSQRAEYCGFEHPGEED